MVIELPSQHIKPNKMLRSQFWLNFNESNTIITQTAPPNIPKTDPWAIFAAFFDPETSPTIMIAVNITAGKAAKTPANIFHGDRTVTK